MYMPDMLGWRSCLSVQLGDVMSILYCHPEGQGHMVVLVFS